MFKLMTNLPLSPFGKGENKTMVNNDIINMKKSNTVDYKVIDISNNKYIIDMEHELIKTQKNIENSNSLVRALAFRIYEGNGVVKRNEVDKIVKSIPANERKKLWGMGIKIGRILLTCLMNYILKDMTFK